VLEASVSMALARVAAEKDAITRASPVDRALDTEPCGHRGKRWPTNDALR